MTSAMLVHVKTLSLWEVAHYWHALDPRETTTHRLPLKVRDTLLVLSMWCSNKVAYRVDKDQAFLFEVAKQAPRFSARHYRHAFKKAIDGKVFGKRFFSGMHIARSHLARLCVQHGEPLPEFWFPDNEKYPYKATGDISDETTVGGRYKLAMIYDDTKQLSGDHSNEQPIATTVSTNAVKAAQARHAKTNEILNLFLTFHDANGSKYGSREKVAIDFYTSLSDNQKSLYKNGAAAVQTLLSGLRKHLKDKKH